MSTSAWHACGAHQQPSALPRSSPRRASRLARKGRWSWRYLATTVARAPSLPSPHGVPLHLGPPLRHCLEPRRACLLPFHGRVPAVVVEDADHRIAHKLAEHGGFEGVQLPALVAELLRVLAVAGVRALGRVGRRAVLLDL